MPSGCAGSAAGGPKVLRHVLVGRYSGVLVFFLFYILTFAVCAAVVIGFGADIVSGVTATIATLGNIGPGLSSVGPMESYAHLHPVNKVVLTLAMWIGRLEVLTVLALLRFEVWRSAHWKGAVR